MTKEDLLMICSLMPIFILGFAVGYGCAVGFPV